MHQARSLKSLRKRRVPQKNILVTMSSRQRNIRSVLARVRDFFEKSRARTNSGHCGIKMCRLKFTNSEIHKLKFGPKRPVKKWLLRTTGDSLGFSPTYARLCVDSRLKILHCVVKDGISTENNFRNLPRLPMPTPAPNRSIPDKRLNSDTGLNSLDRGCSRRNLEIR